MTDPIIEAAARAICRVISMPQDRWQVYIEPAEHIILAAVTPLIKMPLCERIEELEAVLREIKKLGRTRGYGREALARIAAHALKEAWPPPEEQP